MADLLSIELADLTIVKPAGGIVKAFEWIIDGVRKCERPHAGQRQV